MLLVSEAPFRPEHFKRQDEREDALYYTAPRLMTHVDDRAIDSARALYAELLPPDGAILDMMSSWKSHLPEDLARKRTVGLGMNDVEMRENGQLDDYVVHDVNADPALPFGDAEFDGGVMTVSVQYLIRPVDVFADLRRVLKPGAPFIVTFSNRIFPEKAVAIWLACNAEERARLVGAYFHYAGGWGESTAQDRSPNGTGEGETSTDPLYAVWARAEETG